MSSVSAARLERPHTAGPEIQRLRESYGLRSSDVERMSRLIADRGNTPELVITRPTLAGIERGGAIPTVYKLVSLGVILNLELERLLQLYGINITCLRRDGRNYRDKVPDDRDILLRMSASSTAATRGTRLIPNASPTESWVRNVSGQSARICHAIIGADDDLLYDVLPSGSMVRINRIENRVISAIPRTLLQRPIYCLWDGAHYMCCWCDQQNGIITIHPHPMSRQKVRRLRTPQDVTVVGRVTHICISCNSDGDSAKRGRAVP